MGEKVGLHKPVTCCTCKPVIFLLMEAMLHRTLKSNSTHMLFAKLFLLCSLTIMIVDNNYIIYIHVTIQYTYTLVDLVSPNFSDICKPWYYYHNTMHCITVIKSFIFNLDIHQSTRCADTKLYIHCTTVVIKIQNIHIVTPKKNSRHAAKGL